MGAALSTARIELDGTDFYPGQMIRGTVCAELDSEVDFRSIELEVRGTRQHSKRHLIPFCSGCTGRTGAR